MAASAGGIKAGAEWCLQLRSVTLTRRKWYAHTYLRLGAQAILHSKWRLRRAETAVFGAGCARRGAMIDATPVTAMARLGSIEPLPWREVRNSCDWQSIFIN